MPAVAYPHIVTDAHGALRVEGAQYKVIVLLESTLARELSIDEMLESWPELTRAQAHALMAYYHDNKAELDELMREREALIREDLARPEVQAHQDHMREKIERWKREFDGAER
jgi:uncharacterized protein (DUF433 family)